MGPHPPVPRPPTTRTWLQGIAIRRGEHRHQRGAGRDVGRRTADPQSCVIAGDLAVLGLEARSDGSRRRRVAECGGPQSEHQPLTDREALGRRRLADQGQHGLVEPGEAGQARTSVVPESAWPPRDRRQVRRRDSRDRRTRVRRGPPTPMPRGCCSNTAGSRARRPRSGRWPHRRRPSEPRRRVRNDPLPGTRRSAAARVRSSRADSAPVTPSRIGMYRPAPASDTTTRTRPSPPSRCVPAVGSTYRARVVASRDGDDRERPRHDVAARGGTGAGRGGDRDLVAADGQLRDRDGLGLERRRVEAVDVEPETVGIDREGHLAARVQRGAVRSQPDRRLVGDEVLGGDRRVHEERAIRPVPRSSPRRPAVRERRPMRSPATRSGRPRRGRSRRPGRPGRCRPP